MSTLDDVGSDLKASLAEPDYTAVNTLWLALIKLANLEKGKSEPDRTLALIGRIPAPVVKAIVDAGAVDALLNLDPPLETIISHEHEQLRTNKVVAALNKVRACRVTDPREALVSLGDVLKIIRNKREHGFKTRIGPRDAEILGPSRLILEQLCRAAHEAKSSA